MSEKGFVIFRDPGYSRIPVAWSGYFENAGSEFPKEKTFLLHAWSQNSPLQILKIEAEFHDQNEFQKLIESAVLQKLQRDSSIQKNDFIRFVEFAKTGIAQADFDKIVVSRYEDIFCDTSNIVNQFFQLCTQHESAYVSLVYHPEMGLWVGASPERLFYSKNGRAETMALAGTLISQKESWTEKERNEQNIIGEFFRNIFDELNIQDAEFGEKKELKQGELKHISEKVVFPTSGISFSTWLEKLHPTPAVGGFPQKSAVSFIDRFENYDRELFTGWMGWSEADQISTWVNLRCARVYKNALRLFAGCGINTGSDPEKEWNETAAKMNIIKSIF